ncbi:MAG: copper oxidase [Chloroflexi bacterium]|nr:copper oxidase [Chloroflexota bacterium]
MAVDELHDGRHVSGDGRADDGSRHAGHGADGAHVLGRHVGGRHGRPHRVVPGQCLDGPEGAQAWHGDAARPGSRGPLDGGGGCALEAGGRSTDRRRGGWTMSGMGGHAGMSMGDGQQDPPKKRRTGGRGGSSRGAAGPRAGTSSGARGSLDVADRVTRPQLVAVTTSSLVALAAALVFAASTVNLSLGARDVGGLVMPPGMIMTRDTPGRAMQDMAAVDPRTVSYRAPADARGDQPLEARLEGGVKVYDLEASVIEWNILPYERVMAYAFNRQVPGPRITLVEGDQVRFNVTNRLPFPTSVHWHGLEVPNQMDGAAEVTQPAIAPGATFTYAFQVRQAGTFFYHSHADVDRQQALGLYGALIVAPQDPAQAPQADRELVVQLQEWNEREGYTFPAMPMEGVMPNFFTINGKSYPSTESVPLRVGQRLLIRFIGSQSAFIHPMHVHGGPFTVVATDGVSLAGSARYEKDTLNIAPGERYDVVWTAREPGRWLLHCHINHHTTNDNVEEAGGGGLMLVLDVSP